jgi:cytochrome c oxidase cbb3-type subunit 3
VIIDFNSNHDFNEQIYKEVISDKNFQSSIPKKYLQFCQTCHGQLAEGRIGPNLTDKYWIHGKGSVQDIYKVIRYGVTSRGMRSYQKVLSDKVLIGISYYLKTLQGSKPQGAKAPQGGLVK